MKSTLAILGGGLVKDGNTWRTTNFNEGDEHGALGDRLRVVAAATLYREEGRQPLVALGGRGQLVGIPDAPTVATVIKQELVALGVAAGEVITEERSGTTWQQLQELKKIIQAEGFASVAVISNEYHLPRVRAMVEQDVQLAAMLAASTLMFVSAEAVLKRYVADEWAEYINAAYRSEAMQERLRLEARGTAQIKEGTYEFH